MSAAFQPLRGVTILAWEQAVSLPFATRLLADLGATVIRVDAGVRGAQRPRYLANDLVRNKLSIALDLRGEQGQALFRRLVRAVDVVCENYTPRVKRQFHLTYDELKAERPDLIMLSLSGYGQTGAWSERPTYGPGIEAASGHAQSMGFPDLPPTRPGTVVYADNTSGMYAAFAILAALQHRRATGQGRFIDLSMYEANAYHLSLSLARSSRTGEPEQRRGNAGAGAAFQDVLPANAPGRWLAVTVRPSQVEAVRRLLGVPEGDLGEALRCWAAARSAEDGARELQAAGIAASPVQNARDVLLDEQLRHRGAFTPITHDVPVNGYRQHPHGASPLKFDGLPRPELREAPAVGQDTRLVLHRWLQLDDGEIDRLIAEGVVREASTTPPVAPRRDPAMLEKQIGWKLIDSVDPEPERTLGLSRESEVPDASRA
jgi:crotonobetainyl-CoA:carnitine CoA-transferase CaiB-like acyl-CoA transferase